MSAQRLAPGLQDDVGKFIAGGNRAVEISARLCNENLPPGQGAGRLSL